MDTQYAACACSPLGKLKQTSMSYAAGAEKMTLMAALGHACEISYKSQEHLAKHPEFAWMKEILGHAGVRRDAVRGQIGNRLARKTRMAIGVLCLPKRS